MSTQSIFNKSLETAILSNNLNLSCNYYSKPQDVYDYFKEMQNEYKDLKNPNLSNNVLNFLLNKNNEFKSFLISEEASSLYEKMDINNIISNSFMKFDSDLLNSLNKKEINYLIQFMNNHNNDNYHYKIVFNNKTNKEHYSYIKKILTYEDVFGEAFINRDISKSISNIFHFINELNDAKKKENIDLNFEEKFDETLNIFKRYLTSEDTVKMNVPIYPLISRYYEFSDKVDNDYFELINLSLDLILNHDIGEDKTVKNIVSFIEKNLNNLLKVLKDSEFKIKDIQLNKFMDVFNFFKNRNIQIDDKNIKYFMVGYDDKESLINKNVDSVVKHIESFNLNESVQSFYISIVYKYNNKKGFLNMLKTFNEEDFFTLDKITSIGNRTLFNSELMKFININNLNKQMFKLFMETFIDESSTNNLLRKFEENEVNECTPQELVYIVNNMQVLIIDLFFHYKKEDLKVDERLAVLKSMPKDLIFNRLSLGQDLESLKQPYLYYQTVIKEIKSKDVKELIHLYKNYKNIPKNVALILHLFKDKYPILNNITKTDDLKFLQDNEDLIVKYEGKSLEEIQMIYMNNSNKVKEFKSFLNVKDEKFFEKHLDRFMSFYKKGLIEKSMTYINTVRYNEQKDNFKLILKAEIAGRLNEIKFNITDLVDELNMKTINSDLANKWFTNTTKRSGRFTVKEVSDFQTLFEMGENPVNSCMSYNNGMYNYCLLSIFDSNKKIIAIYDNEKLVGRAILRFTKIKEGNSINIKGIGFKDIEMMDANEETPLEIYDESKDLTLFIERLYTNYNSSEIQAMNSLIIELMKEKAKDLNVKLTISNEYRMNNIKIKQTDKLNMFISHSKNGKQYLDSLGGSQDAVNGGQYYPANYIHLIDLDN